jgi:hypothetical protein
VITTDLTPPRPSRDVKRSFLVVCEDEIQRAYLEWLKSYFGHPLLTTRLFPERLSLEETMAHAASVRKSEKTKGTHFDEVWCLITVESTAVLDISRFVPRPVGIHIAAQVGSFVDWIKLHWEQTDKLPQVLVQEASPSGFAAALDARIGTAMRRASAMPSVTSIHELVLALDDASKSANAPKDSKV